MKRRDKNRIKPPTNKKKLEQKRHVMKIEIKGFIENNRIL